jgi:hypothetical protein
MKSYIIASVSVLLSITAAAPSANNISTLFSGLSPGASIYYKTDPNWTGEVIQRWTFYEAPAYYAAIKPATPADVQTIVSF